MVKEGALVIGGVEVEEFVEVGNELLCFVDVELTKIGIVLFEGGCYRRTGD